MCEMPDNCPSTTQQGPSSTFIHHQTSQMPPGDLTRGNQPKGGPFLLTPFQPIICFESLGQKIVPLAFPAEALSSLLAEATIPPQRAPIKKLVIGQYDTFVNNWGSEGE